ncbi:LysM peptidoglycan-binding domain-containing protein [Yoonia sp. I 8.24]|uniref:LysM peptidoglycan-binding domain-containing protein n=1 Tax=Yoonia sp. I 8.24 TaxID=1537229 RepID=UPI001EDCC1CA|nr:LysM peptidoglycan-binding domain-containing protein [Yoonia sp. I 8.24]MCG3266372.1 transporter substrate-binding domain-containing protein [Yoonia sp. I 8.24]
MSKNQPHTIWSTFKRVAFLSSTGCAASLGLVAASATQVHAQEQCATYTVVRGDVLSSIARRADVRGGYQALYNANTDILPSPNLLEVGQVLKIPCADGSLPLTLSVAAPAVSTAPTLQPDSLDRPLRLVTSSGYAPFTDESLPGGGLFTQMVRRSLELGNEEQAFDIMFVNDWGSHLEVLLPSGAIDMAFPWYRPDCSKLENLSAPNAVRCTDFNHSEPFYDALVGYYTLAGSAYENADTYEDLYGARLCRPEVWFTFDLEAEALVAPNIELIQAETQAACWDLLREGEVDVVTYDALPAEEDADNAGMTDVVVDLPELTSQQTLHVFVSKTNPNGDAYMDIINAGLEDLRLSGEWFEIVREGIKTTVEN